MNPLIASMVGPRGAKQFARTTNRSLGDLDAAKRLLGGRRWSELPREDKLEIKRNTGWQLGPGGDWLYETDTDPVLTPAFNERFSPWLAADKGFSAALKTLYDTVESLKAEESAIANSWNERHPRSLYISFLPHIYNPSYAPRVFAAESALSDYDSAVKFATRFREDEFVDTRDREMYRTAERFLDRPELSKAIAEMTTAMRRAKKTEFKPFAGRLSDVVDLSADPEFAIAYPDFKDIDVAIVDAKDPELMGSFSAKDNKLTITKRNLQKHGLSGALRTALHELAHVRQAKEGAAPGGDEMTYIIDSPPGRDILGAYRERLTRMEDTLANGSWLSKQLLGGPETLRNRIDVYRRTLAFLDQERSRFDQIAARADQADDESSRKYYLYRRLAGEVDARNTETRQGLDREARSSTLLEDTEDIPRSDQIDARFGVVPGWTVSKAATVLEEHPYILQQAAKGGESGRGKRESTAPTDEQLQEAAAFLRLVIEKGFAKTDDEIEKCERLARAIEAAVGAEPVKPKEAPLEARPLRPTAETQAAIDAGKADEDEDLFGRNGTVETTAQDVKDFKSDEYKDLFGRNGTVETTAQDVEDFESNADRAAVQPAAPGQEQPAPQVAVRPRQEQPAQQVAVQPRQEQPAQQVAVQPQQEQLAPGLARSGSRSNILEFNGRRISQREFDRIQAKFLEGGGAQQPQAARPVQQPQVTANDVDDALKPNKLRQTTQVDSGRKDALGRPLDEYGRVIA